MSGVNEFEGTDNMSDSCGYERPSYGVPVPDTPRSGVQARSLSLSVGTGVWHCVPVSRHVAACWFHHFFLLCLAAFI